jgi:hypothetical protein
MEGKMEFSAHLPSFLIIGGKAGSTSIHQYLRQHPAVSLPKRKETHFFVCDRDGTASPESYFGRQLLNPINNLDDYIADFEDGKEKSFFGEVCPSYLFFPNAAENIYRRIPNAKIVCLLRNPVERFYSNYQFNKNLKSQENNKVSDFTRADFDKLTLDLENCKDHQVQRYLAEGKYYEQLSRYMSIFPSENIRIYLFDELQKNPKWLMTSLAEFIGLPSFEFDVNMKFNVSGKFRFFWIYKTFRGSKAAHLFQRVFPPIIYQRIRYYIEGMVFKRDNGMSVESRKRLNSYYYREIIALQELLGRDLSDWLQ